MRYRELDVNGDMVFGHGSLDFLINSPACVGQAIQTRLLLIQGEWFLDRTVGMPYATEVFVEGARATADRAAKAVILGTQGVTQIASYASFFGRGRGWRAQARVDTVYGQTALTVGI